MTISDEQIAALCHGELTPEEAARVEALLLGDPIAAARATRLRALDELMRKAVPLDDDLPPALLARLGLAATTEPSNVVDIAEARAAAVVIGHAPVLRPARFGFATRRMAVQFVVMLGVTFGATLYVTAPGVAPPTADYVTLGDAPSGQAPANALVMFAGESTSGKARALAASVGARVIGGPTKSNGWRLAIDPARRDSVLERLRARRDIKLAEPIDDVAG